MTLQPRPTSVVNWAEGPAEFLTTDPGYAKKVVGWDEDEKPVSEHHNWLIRELAKWTRYLTGYVETRFLEVHEALTAGIAYPSTFKLYAPTEQRYSGGIGATKQFAANALDIMQILTDGASVYGRLKSGGIGAKLVAVRPDDPDTALWTFTSLGDLKLAACDGRFVYAYDAGAFGGTYLKHPDTGANVALFNPVSPVVSAPLALVANGWMIAIRDTALPAVIEVFSMDSAATPTITHAGTVDLTGSTSIHMAMHGSVLYVAHVDAAVAAHVAAYAMDNACALLFDRDITADFVGNPTPAAIACDGHRIYLATDSVESKAGVIGPIHALSPALGEWIWTAAFGAVDAKSLALSSGLVMAGIDAGAGSLFVFTIDAANGSTIRLLSGPDASTVIAADELCFYMRWASSPDTFTRIWRGGPIVEMQVANPQDPWRGPNPHRAVPVR